MDEIEQFILFDFGYDKCACSVLVHGGLSVQERFPSIDDGFSPEFQADILNAGEVEYFALIYFLQQFGDIFEMFRSCDDLLDSMDGECDDVLGVFRRLGFILPDFDFEVPATFVECEDLGFSDHDDVFSRMCAVVSYFLYSSALPAVENFSEDWFGYWDFVSGCDEGEQGEMEAFRLCVRGGEECVE